MIKKIVGWLLVAHGLLCLLGAFFPFYPPIYYFYCFFPAPFAMILTIVLVAGAVQIVFGVYMVFIEKLRRIVRWYWLVVAIVVLVVLLLIYPALNYFFGI